MQKDVSPPYYYYIVIHMDFINKSSSGYHLFSLADVVLAPSGLGPLLPSGRPCNCYLWSGLPPANFMMELESKVATQSCVNRQCKRRLKTQPCGTVTLLGCSCLKLSHMSHFTHLHIFFICQRSYLTPDVRNLLSGSVSCSPDTWTNVRPIKKKLQRPLYDGNDWLSISIPISSLHEFFF